jgi:hypothetical protein
VPHVFAGQPGDCGSDDGKGALARFGADVTCPACPPLGITGDGPNLYVADHLTVRKVVIAGRDVTTLTPAGPPWLPQQDITVAAGRIYVNRGGIVIASLATTGGPVTDVTSLNEARDHLGYTPTRASATYAFELLGLVAEPDGHRIFVTNRTGVGVIED